MAFPRNSLRAFLAHAKSSLHSALDHDPTQNLTFVIGNESADLDSLTSSLLYAYLRSLTSTLHTPLLNIPARDLPLRPEFSALLAHANLSPSHVLTFDDLPPLQQIRENLPPERTKWVLVDHNRLLGELGKVYGGRVRGVVDHHEDEGGELAEGREGAKKVIEKCGSCTSLVVRELRGAWDGLSASALSSGAGHGQGEVGARDDAAMTRTWDAQVAQVALGSILIDTRNLTDASKTTETDEEAVKYLEAKIRVSSNEGKGWDRARFYEEIDAAKADIEGLKLEDMLRKDYKKWEERGGKLGMSSVVKPLEFLARKAGEEGGAVQKGGDGDAAFDKAISTFMSARNLSLYAIMTTATTPSGEFRRHLLLQTSEGEEGGKFRTAAERFVKNASEELGLESVSDKPGITALQADDLWRKVWQQGNVGASRKQVAPMLRKAMADSQAGNKS